MPLPGGRKSAEEMTQERRLKKLAQKNGKKKSYGRDSVSVFEAAKHERVKRQRYMESQVRQDMLRIQYRQGAAVNACIQQLMERVDEKGFVSVNLANCQVGNDMILWQACHEIQQWCDKGCNGAKVRHVATMLPKLFALARLKGGASCA